MHPARLAIGKSIYFTGTVLIQFLQKPSQIALLTDFNTRMAFISYYFTLNPTANIDKATPGLAFLQEVLLLSKAAKAAYFQESEKKLRTFVHHSHLTAKTSNSHPQLLLSY